MTKAPVVRVAELNPNCEGCMAAQRVIHMKTEGTALAIKKIRKQCDEIEQLRSQNSKLIACLKRAYECIDVNTCPMPYLDNCSHMRDGVDCITCQKKYIAHG